MLHFSRCLQCLFQGQASVKQRKAWDAAAHSVASTTTKVGYSCELLVSLSQYPRTSHRRSEVVPFCCSLAESFMYSCDVHFHGVLCAFVDSSIVLQPFPWKATQASNGLPVWILVPQCF